MNCVHLCHWQLNTVQQWHFNWTLVHTSFVSCLVPMYRQTLTARATRLESTRSRARLEAENEAYKRETIAKRRRAVGPKNSSDFMRQTIRDRAETREANRVKADLRGSQLPVQAKRATPRRGSLNQPLRGASSEIALSLPLRETTRSCDSNHSAPTSMGIRTGHAGRAGCDGQERPPASTQKVRCSWCFTRDHMFTGAAHSLPLVFKDLQNVRLLCT